MENKSQVYARIYDITKNTLESVWKEMVFTKEAFLYSADCDLQYVNCFDLVDYDNETLLQVLYIALFYRTPEQGARVSWGKLAGMPQKDFQKKCFQVLSSSAEYLRSRTVVGNNIFTDASVQIAAASAQTNQANPYVERMYSCYRRLPMPLKNAAKRLLGGRKS